MASTDFYTFHGACLPARTGHFRRYTELRDFGHQRGYALAWIDKKGRLRRHGLIEKVGGDPRVTVTADFRSPAEQARIRFRRIVATVRRHHSFLGQVRWYAKAPLRAGRNAWAGLKRWWLNVVDPLDRGL